MRKRQRNRLLRIGLCLVTLAIATGCGEIFAHFGRQIARAMQPTVRAHPQLQQRLASIKTVAIMPPGATVYQIQVGGAIQVMKEETATARATLATAIEQELGRDARVVFTPFPEPSAGLDASRDPAAARLTAELEDTQALFDAVSASIVLHTYKYGEPAVRVWMFVEKLTNFDYSLGPDVQQFAKLANADALLFTSNVDFISSWGRKSLTAIVPLAHFIMTVPIGGGGGEVRLPSGPTAFSVALVDATTGELLWYNVAGLYGGVYSLADLPAPVLKDFPLGTRPTRREEDRSDWPSGLDPR